MATDSKGQRIEPWMRKAAENWFGESEGPIVEEMKKLLAKTIAEAYSHSAAGPETCNQRFTCVATGAKVYNCALPRGHEGDCDDHPTRGLLSVAVSPEETKPDILSRLIEGQRLEFVRLRKVFETIANLAKAELPRNVEVDSPSFTKALVATMNSETPPEHDGERERWIFEEGWRAATTSNSATEESLRLLNEREAEDKSPDPGAPEPPSQPDISEVTRFWDGQKYRFCPNCQLMAFRFAGEYAEYWHQIAQKLGVQLFEANRRAPLDTDGDALSEEADPTCGKCSRPESLHEIADHEFQEEK